MDQTKNDGKLKTQLGTNGYQSPELIEGQFYSGSANDIFACGVILFILVNAYPPFREGRRTDNWYRHIYYEKFDNFWGLHLKRGIKISDDLKSLITIMLKYKNRATIEDIMNSVWFNGDLPTTEEFNDDMTERKGHVDARRDREASEKVQVSDDNTEGKVFRDLEDNEFERLLAQLEEFGCNEFQMKAWGNYNTRNTITFEGTNGKSVYEKLLDIFVAQKAVLDLDKTAFRLNCIWKIVSDEIVEDEKVADEEVEFNMELFVDYNNQSVIVEFIKGMDANAFSFRQVFSEIQEKLK